GGSSITAGTGTAVPGTDITYTITASNSGPSTAASQLVPDTFPAAITSDIWSGSDGSSGTGPISDTVTLLPGSSVTFTVVAHIDPSATGTLSNTVHLGNLSATDNDTLTPQFNLAFTTLDKAGGSSITASTGTAVPGTDITYTIVA